MAALLDVVSDGRLVLGLGAGWMTSDYEAAGIALDPAGVRVSRFAEALAVIKGLFAPSRSTSPASTTPCDALDGLPKPAQHPHPPFFVGGGSPRGSGSPVARPTSSASTPASTPGSWARTRSATCRSSASPRRSAGYGRVWAAGRDPDSLELEMNHWLATCHAQRERGRRICSSRGCRASTSTLGPRRVTVGARRHRRRSRRHAPGPGEQLGISYLQLDAGFPTPDLRRVRAGDRGCRNLRTRGDHDLRLRRPTTRLRTSTPGSTIR